MADQTTDGRFTLTPEEAMRIAQIALERDSIQHAISHVEGEIHRDPGLAPYLADLHRREAEHDMEFYEAACPVVERMLKGK